MLIYYKPSGPNCQLPVFIPTWHAGVEHGHAVSELEVRPGQYLALKVDIAATRFSQSPSRSPAGSMVNIPE